jgi:hypothetical protein
MGQPLFPKVGLTIDWFAMDIKGASYATNTVTVNGQTAAIYGDQTFASTNQP